MHLFRRFCIFVCKLFCYMWFRITIFGVDNIPKHGKFIIVSNHRSYFDPVLIGTNANHLMYYMAKEELFRIKPFGALLRHLGVFPVNRESGGKVAMQHAINLLHEGHGLVLFPEGTRSKTRTLLPFKAGVLLIAKKAKAPMIPCAVSIAEGKRFRSKVTVRYGVPIEYNKLLVPGDRLPAETQSALRAQPTADSARNVPPLPSKVSLKQAAELMRAQVIDLLAYEEGSS